MRLGGRFEINFEAATGVRGRERERERERACARLGEREGVESERGRASMISVGFQLWLPSVLPPEQTDDASAPAPLSAVRTVRGVRRSSPESLWRNSNSQTPAGRCAPAPPPPRNAMRLPLRVHVAPRRPL